MFEEGVDDLIEELLCVGIIDVEDVLVVDVVVNWEIVVDERNVEFVGEVVVFVCVDEEVGFECCC